MNHLATLQQTRSAMNLELNMDARKKKAFVEIDPLG
jgi:hypothetical protein